ncbi:efflux RND transporter periplasmic adaptor subunit [Sporomusa sphaeroides]|uniref:Multidrug export protein AcrE n=1 Tax=Sporomusa sphaeroides DSM 2875 TaxID=1337886 RepID=A0ABM9W5E6_9FIRM|nr:efflux RND transporter periplasmic adaptor subunit [Sporomusa sphaeroides]OLS57277.1 multidrug export protein AcrE precursor [Sporomusa sphaeroides DSM 2875]CVK20180.1 Multidrug export protein AcrE precursor [Sporomusa sphaeroides DSM 2875]
MFLAKIMKNYYAGLSVMAIILLIAGCGGKQTAVPQKGAVPVKAVKVIQQDITRANEYAGQIQGKNEVRVQARVSGNIVEKMVSGGDIVKRGQPLFRIDPIQYESTLLSAEAQLAQAVANWENSRTDTERYQSLLNASAIPEQRLTTQKATERQNEALVASYRALVRKAQDDLNSTLVVSPVDGRLDVNDVSVGTYAQAGSTTLVSVGALDSVFVQFNISENEYLDLRQASQQNLAGWGEDVMITLSNGSVYPLRGKVTQVDRGLANNSGTLTVKASIANPDGILIPGMFTRVKIDGALIKDAVLVPQRAVQQVLDKSLVMVVNAENQAEVRSVILGEKVGSFWLIKEGLTNNDVVIVEGLTKAQEGAALAVTVVAPEELGLSFN